MAHFSHLRVDRSRAVTSGETDMGIVLLPPHALNRMPSTNADTNSEGQDD